MSQDEIRRLTTEAADANRDKATAQEALQQTRVHLVEAQVSQDQEKNENRVKDR